MSIDYNEQFQRTLKLTKIIKAPIQKIFTFWDTEFNYFIISGNFSTTENEKSVLRQGVLQCRKPAIITPHDFSQFFSGFDEISETFAKENYHAQLEKLRVLGYQFKNTLHKQEKLMLSQRELIKRVIEENQRNHNATILSAPDDIWNLALTRAAIEIVTHSASQNIQDLSERGFFKTEEEKIREEIEIKFAEAANDRNLLNELGKALQDYNLYEEYEDRFYSLLQK